MIRSYNWGALGLVSDRTGTSSRYYFYDTSGSTRALLDANGTVIGKGGYTAWGSPINAALTPGTACGWNGRFGVRLDSETGLLLCGARYYAPNLGRFISRDPSGWTCGPNLYAYALCDPVSLFDRNGLEPDPYEGAFDTPVGSFVERWIRPADRFVNHVADMTAGPVGMCPIWLLWGWRHALT